MREICMSGSMSGEGKPPAASRSLSSALPRLYDNLLRASRQMINVLLADDHAILREGLKEILLRDLEGAVCGEAENAQQVLAKVQRQDWDLVILDVTMPGRTRAPAFRWSPGIASSW